MNREKSIRFFIVTSMTKILKIPIMRMSSKPRKWYTEKRYYRKTDNGFVNHTESTVSKHYLRIKKLISQLLCVYTRDSTDFGVNFYVESNFFKSQLK